MVERFLAKEEVAGSNPVRRSILGRVLPRLRRVAIRRFAPEVAKRLITLAGVAEWYTRSVQNAVPKGLEVRVLSPAPGIPFLLRQKLENSDGGGIVRSTNRFLSRPPSAEMAELVYAQS